MGDLKIEGGKTYRTEGDRLIDIYESSENFPELYRFHGYAGYGEWFWYNERGKVFVNDHDTDQIFLLDLTEEVDMSSHPPRLKLEVGRTYLTRDGKHKVWISCKNPNTNVPQRTFVGEFEESALLNRTRYYTQEGRYWSEDRFRLNISHEDHQYDLVQEVVSTKPTLVPDPFRDELHLTVDKSHDMVSLLIYKRDTPLTIRILTHPDATPVLIEYSPSL